MTVQEFRELTQAVAGPHTGLPPMSKAVIDSLYFNTALHVVESIDLPWLRGDDSQNIVAGQADYYLPVNLHVPLSVHRYASTYQVWEKLDAVLPEDAIQTSTVNDEYTTYSHCGVETSAGGDYGRWKIKLYPTPTEAITNGLRVLYKKKPTKLASHSSDSAEIVEFPESLLMPMAHRCVWLLASRGGMGNASKDIASYNLFYESELRRVAARFNELQNHDAEVRQMPGSLTIRL